MAKGVVLVGDDDASVRMVINQALAREGFEVRITSNFSNLWKWIENGEGNCVISDVIMPDGNAFEILPRIQKTRPDLPVILISAQNTFMTALKAQDADVFEYLPKPFDLNTLIDAVNRAIFELKPEKQSAPHLSGPLELPLVGRSPAMQDIYRTLARLRQSPYPVLLSGESGTGKSQIAKVIHDFGPRASEPFTVINIEPDQDVDLEAKLHAPAGTIFLNDVLHLSENQQAILFRLLRDSEANSEKAVKFPRIVSATVGDTQQAIRGGVFREDLYHRLSMIPVNIPPLRSRLEDVSDLARHFVKQSAEEGAVNHHIETEAMLVLKNHLWPGNVRELENVIKRLCLLNHQETITAEMIDTQIAPITDESKTEKASNIGFENLTEATQYFAERFFETRTDTLSEEGIYPDFLGQFERPLITATLSETNGNQIRAAEILGLNRNTLRKKIQHYGIEIVKTVK